MTGPIDDLYAGPQIVYSRGTENILSMVGWAKSHDHASIDYWYIENGDFSGASKSPNKIT